MSSREYFVIDWDGFVSADPHDHEPQAFGRLKDAYERALEMAKSEPGQPVTIAQRRKLIIHELPTPKVRERK